MRHAAWLLSILLLCSAAGVLPSAHTAGDGAAREALKEYRKLDRSQDNSLNALLALQDLAAHDSPVIVDAMLHELSGARIERYRTARRVLEGFRDPRTLNHLIKEGVGHPRPEVRAQCLLALGSGRPSSVDWIPPTEAALDDRFAIVRAAAVEALGLARASGRLGRILELADDPSVRVRQQVPEALVRLAPHRASAILPTLAADSSWRVRASAVRALGSLRTRDSVEELVAILDREVGRIREDALDQLRHLTRQDFGLHVDAWERFLELAPPDFLSTPDESAVATSSGSVVYYGLTSHSTRFVLVTDLSTSMTTIERTTYRSKITASRLQLTKDQMESLVEDLGEDVAINLVTFSDNAEVWQRKLLTMNKKGRAKALAEIESYSPRGGTNLFHALSTCFEMAADSLTKPELEDSTPDTIFLLTDGEPSVGTMLDTSVILEWVEERNRELQVRVHCIALNTQPRSRDFMSRLARITSGQYVNPFD